MNPREESSVKIIGNGVNYGSFKVNEQPIVIEQLVANDFDQWEFVVIDNSMEDCQSKALLGSIACMDDLQECTLRNIEVDNLGCTNNNEYEMLLSFEFNSEFDAEFSCAINGQMQINANTSSLPMKMTGVTSDNSTDVEIITICIDNMTEECCLDYLHKKPNCLSNSVADNSEFERISISPNPATNLISIEDIPQDVIGLTIVDNMGRPLKNIEGIKNLSLDVSKYPNGVYTIFFYTKDNHAISKRFVKL
jgi:hypothetical protein